MLGFSGLVTLIGPDPAAAFEETPDGLPAEIIREILVDYTQATSIIDKERVIHSHNISCWRAVSHPRLFS